METTTGKILIVDDEPDILEFLGYSLRKEGYEVLTALNGKDALQIAAAQKPQLILLDVMMPEMDGIETCEHLRAMPELHRTIIAFLTARSEDYSQIAGFESGGDDYISKPIKPKVLISRIKALLKRFHPESSSPTDNNGVIKLSSLTIDRTKYLVIKDGQEIILPRKEFELLNLLASKPEKVFTREEIYNSIWGSEVVVGDRTIDVHIRKLREKIGDDHITTFKGVGYKFVD